MVLRQVFGLLLLGALFAVGGCSDDDPVRPEPGDPTRYLVVEGNFSLFDLTAVSQYEQTAPTIAVVEDLDVDLGRLRSSVDLRSLGLVEGREVELTAWVDGTWIDPSVFVVASSPGEDRGARLVDLLDWTEARLADAGVEVTASLALGTVRLTPADDAPPFDQVTLRFERSEGVEQRIVFVRFPERPYFQSSIRFVGPARGSTLLRYVVIADDGRPVLRATAPDTSPVDASSFVVQFQGLEPSEGALRLDVDYGTTTVDDLLAWLEASLDIGGADGSGARIDEDGVLVLRGRVGPEYDLPPFVVYEETDRFARRVDLGLVEVLDASRSRVVEIDVRLVTPDGAFGELTVRFGRVTSAAWDWSIVPAGGLEIVSGGRGRLEFQGPDTYTLRTDEGGFEFVYRADADSDPMSLLVIGGRAGVTQTFDPTHVEVRALATLE